MDNRDMVLVLVGIVGEGWSWGRWQDDTHSATWDHDNAGLVAIANLGEIQLNTVT